MGSADREGLVDSAMATQIDRKAMMRRYPIVVAAAALVVASTGPAAMATPTSAAPSKVLKTSDMWYLSGMYGEVTFTIPKAVKSWAAGWQLICPKADGPIINVGSSIAVWQGMTDKFFYSSWGGAWHQHLFHGTGTFNVSATSACQVLLVVDPYYGKPYQVGARRTLTSWS